MYEFTEAQDLHKPRPNKIPAQRRSRYEAPPLAEKLLTIDSF